MGCVQSTDGLAAEEAQQPPPTGISEERRQEAIRDDKRYSDFVVPEAVLIDTAKCVRIGFSCTFISAFARSDGTRSPLDLSILSHAHITGWHCAAFRATWSASESTLPPRMPPALALMALAPMQALLPRPPRLQRLPPVLRVHLPPSH